MWPSCRQGGLQPFVVVDRPKKEEKMDYVTDSLKQNPKIGAKKTTDRAYVTPVNVTYLGVLNFFLKLKTKTTTEEGSCPLVCIYFKSPPGSDVSTEYSQPIISKVLYLTEIKFGENSIQTTI